MLRGMGRTVSVAERRARLVRRHRLVATERTDDVVALTDDLVALHSSDPVTVYLSAFARMLHPALAPVQAALYEDRSLIRHHAMRRTLWVFGHAAARAAHHAVTVDLVAVQHKRLLGMLSAGGIVDPPGWLAAAADDVAALLAESGPLTAREIGARLPAVAVPIPVGTGRFATTQSAHSRVLLQLGFTGRVVRARPMGTWINGQYRWAATSAWFPGGFDLPAVGSGPHAAEVTVGPVVLGADDRANSVGATAARAGDATALGHGSALAVDRRGAAAELARRWLRTFGPGTRTDLQWWAGWTVATTKRALADVGAIEVELHGGSTTGTGYLLPDDLDEVPDPGPSTALLPGLDPTTMGWKDRDWYLDPAHVPLLFDRNGNAGPTAGVDGRVVGGWAQRPDGEIVLRLLADVGREASGALHRQADELRVLLGDTRFTPRFPSSLHTELVK